MIFYKKALCVGDEVCRRTAIGDQNIHTFLFSGQAGAGENAEETSRSSALCVSVARRAISQLQLARRKACSTPTRLLKCSYTPALLF